MHLNMQIINALQTHEDAPIRKTDHAIDVAIGGTHAADSPEHYNTKAKKFKKYAFTKTRNTSEIEHQKELNKESIKSTSIESRGSKDDYNPNKNQTKAEPILLTLENKNSGKDLSLPPSPPLKASGDNNSSISKAPLTELAEQNIALGTKVRSNTIFFDYSRRKHKWDLGTQDEISPSTLQIDSNRATGRHKEASNDNKSLHESMDIKREKNLGKDMMNAISGNANFTLRSDHKTNINSCLDKPVRLMHEVTFKKSQKEEISSNNVYMNRKFNTGRDTYFDSNTSNKIATKLAIELQPNEAQGIHFLNTSKTRASIKNFRYIDSSEASKYSEDKARQNLPTRNRSNDGIILANSGDERSSLNPGSYKNEHSFLKSNTPDWLTSPGTTQKDDITGVTTRKTVTANTKNKNLTISSIQQHSINNLESEDPHRSHQIIEITPRHDSANQIAIPTLPTNLQSMLTEKTDQELPLNATHRELIQII